MKFSYNWIREMVPGLDQSPQELHAPDHHEDRRVRRASKPVGRALRAASVARVVAVEWIDGSHNQDGRRGDGAYGAKTVVCGAPNCRPGMLTVYVAARRRK